MDYLQQQSEHPLYEVQEGDSLLKIAYLNNVNERSIIQLNDLLGSEVYPGQVLKLPISKDVA